MKDEILKRFPVRPPREFTSPYAAGYDAARRGPNLVNCHFAWFTAPQKTAAWEWGNRDGKESWKACGFAGIPSNGPAEPR